jgi:hypothetical protein
MTPLPPVDPWWFRKHDSAHDQMIKLIFLNMACQIDRRMRRESAHPCRSLVAVGWSLTVSAIGGALYLGWRLL